MLTSKITGRAVGYWWRARYRRQISRRLAELDTKAVAIVSDDAHDMIHAHLAFLDHLTRESNTGIDYRVEFLTFYIQQHPDKARVVKKGAHGK